MSSAEPPSRAGFFLVGPTAVGKTAVAQRLAEASGRPILSADSMLLYQGMDIGTAKPTMEERARVEYWGVDLASPAESFSVAAYLDHVAFMFEGRAVAAPEPIVVGGTGLYVKALTDGLAAAAPPSFAARARWESTLAREGVGALQQALCRTAPDVYRALADPANPRRLIRALERVDAGADEAPAPTWNGEPERRAIAGLRMPMAALSARIDRRVAAMYDAGLLDEVEGLLRDAGLGRTTAAQAIGYAEAAAVLRGELSRDEAMARTARRTRRLAKRQMTWFRGQARVDWIDVDPAAPLDSTIASVRAYWKAHGPTPIDI